MELIVDANILFSLTNPASYTYFIVDKYALNLFSLDYTLLELEKHKEEVVAKSKQSFNESIRILKEKVVFIPVKTLRNEIQECKHLTNDQADVVYLALAKKLNFPLWSNDSHFKQQSLIPVLTTRELLTLLPFE